MPGMCSEMDEEQFNARIHRECTCRWGNCKITKPKRDATEIHAFAYRQTNEQTSTKVKSNRFRFEVLLWLTTSVRRVAKNWIHAVDDTLAIVRTN